MNELNKYTFITEVGAIIDENGNAMAIIDGTIGSVEFPEEYIWTIHKTRPGFINRFAHIHPPGMTQLSSRDKNTLKTWAFAMYPFVPRISTITVVSDFLIQETIYAGLLEPKELWIEGGKGKRMFEIVTEHEIQYTNPIYTWMEILMKRGYIYNIDKDNIK